MKLLLLAGTHGVEKQSSFFLDRFINDYRDKLEGLSDSLSLEKLSLAKLFDLEASEYETNCKLLEKNNLKIEPQNSKHKIIAIPVLNPTGLKNLTRTNANLVDLNRNMPSQNWEFGKLKLNGEDNPYYPGEFPKSEIETQLLTQILDNNHIDLVISFHTNHFVRNKNEAQINYDGQGNFRSWAESFAQLLKLPFTQDIGYPTPGSLGSYAKENKFDCVTVEFEDSESEEKIYCSYNEAFFKSLSELF